MYHGQYTIIRVYEESKKALFSPREYFAEMETAAGWGEPIYKGFIYGVAAGLFILLWSFLDIIGITEGVLTGDVGVIGFFSTLAGAVAGVFIGGVIIIIVSSVCNGRTEFESGLRIASVLMVFLPLNAFLGFLDGISYVMGAVISLGANLYGVYMLYTALTIILKAREKPARTFSYILSGILVLSLVIVLYARNSVQNYQERLEEKTEERIPAVNRNDLPVHSLFLPVQSDIFPVRSVSSPLQ
ncbi:MAG: YIP1 family protein [Bacteroidota bacterium]